MRSCGCGEVSVGRCVWGGGCDCVRWVWVC